MGNCADTVLDVLCAKNCSHFLPTTLKVKMISAHSLWTCARFGRNTNCLVSTTSALLALKGHRTMRSAVQIYVPASTEPQLGRAQKNKGRNRRNITNFTKTKLILKLRVRRGKRKKRHFLRCILREMGSRSKQMIWL